ncbi:MAG: bifunctional acetate--CoA ligase family protein/GNAT family N-acetyltransferase [Steroidobacteraceae bacterium]
MSSRNLEHLFNPQSVALIGASDRAHSIGATVMRNLLRGGFRGPVWPVNLRHATVAGREAYPTIESLPAAPDLAVICTPAASVPGLITALGRRGTRAAVVISAGLEQPAAAGGTLATAMLQAARPFQLRILGPNCIGLLVPGIGLDASFAHVGASAGSLAFVAQSGALTTALLDWARGRHVGFSHFISLGNAADIDFGDLLDYLGRDLKTRAILLYAESISSARKFMSAARATARAKPVIVVKSGRTAASARAAQSHSGALAGSDAVYDAAFRRAGILRVDTLRELFDAAEILSRWRSYAGPRLAIVTNGGGPAVLATDALVGGGGELAELSADSVQRLDRILPGASARANPLDLGGDARPERYLAALDVVLEDPGADALLLMHAPTAVASVSEIAAACAPKLASGPRPALACWLGAGTNSRASAAVPEISAIPSYSTPEEAVGAFQHVVRYHQSQALLLEAPAVTPPPGRPDIQLARATVVRALAQNRQTLTEPESKAILAAYGIPVVATRVARELKELGPAARDIGYPVALKILSPDITHKSDVGGVALNIESAEELEHAAEAMLQRCRASSPAARIEGFTVQKMIRRGGAHELLAGIAFDPTFGPTIVFGQGGTAVELIADRALALPPLNARLARELIARTRIHRLLLGYRDCPPTDMGALERALIGLSQLAADMPEIAELDINPLLADKDGVIALDARIRLERTALQGSERFAIRPYPAELEEAVALDGHALRLRPIRPEDFAQHKRFLSRCSQEDLHARFLSTFHELPDADIARLTQIDYDREMAFIAEESDASGGVETLGVARVSTDPDNIEADFAILVRSDFKRHGLGQVLLAKLIRYCRDRGTARMTSSVLSGNASMLGLGADLGFTARLAERGIMEVSLDLQASEKTGAAASTDRHPNAAG